jgi:formamidopyrimidine-DNA glycosylase
MFELPEMVVLSRQMNASLKGKVIQTGSLGNSPHKFVWYNRTHDEFAELIRGKTVGEAHARGRWLFLPADPGYVVVLGECGGKVLFHPAGASEPAKYHLMLHFEDGSFFSATTQMWGAMELFVRGEECQRVYIRDMRTTPIEPGFTFDYFCALIEEVLQGEKRSAKGLLTQEQLIPGLGNAIAQDILFQARLHPRHPVEKLDTQQKCDLYQAIVNTVEAVIVQGGRYDEVDLYHHPGGYVRQMDKKAAGQPCPACGTTVESIQYLGGSCYFCPSCQK